MPHDVVMFYLVSVCVCLGGGDELVLSVSERVSAIVRRDGLYSNG